jgi:hypothetical protein
MVFPLIPVGATAAVVLGGVALAWYSLLTPNEKEVADLRANQLAQKWYGTALDKLSKFKFLRVIVAVKQEFTGKQDSDSTGHSHDPRLEPAVATHYRSLIQ